MMDQISFIGGGVMAEAMVQGLLSKKLVGPGKILVSEPRKERREELKARYGILTSDRNEDAVTSSRVVILCVKPQDVNNVLAHLKPILRGA
jgi:pyrroline-5-carboxylate reductase